MEEKVQYQSDERLRDVNEVLENCQTRVSKNSFLVIAIIISTIRISVKLIEKAFSLIVCIEVIERSVRIYFAEHSNPYLSSLFSDFENGTFIATAVCHR